MMIETLQNLRLLPPPCNELVPLLTTIFTFAAVSFVLGDELKTIWKDAVEGWMSSSSVDPSASSLWWTSSKEEQVFVVGSFVIYISVHWGYALFIHIAEHTFPKTLNHFKIQPDVPIASWKEVGKMVPLVVFNQVLFGIPMLKALFAWLNKMATTSQDGDESENSSSSMMFAIPSIPKFAGTMLLHVLCTEIWFYVFHRLLHTPFLYKHVHCIHHYYKAPSPLESVYVHPIEFILNSFAVMVVGPAVVLAILPSLSSMLVVYIWIALVTFLQVHDHTGYWFPFLPRVLMHDYHHQQIRCCYGIIGLLDGLMGTEKEFQQFVKDHEEKGGTGNNTSKKSE